MGFYLNCENDFFAYVEDEIFVDKSGLITFLNKHINRPSSKFFCVTRPRRFGKTMTLSMLNAYYSKGCDSRDMFDKLNISKDSSYLSQLNKHNVIWIDMASVYSDSKDNFLTELVKYVIKDLDKAFPNVLTEDDNTLSKAIRHINKKLGERFIFLIDEWDVIFREKPQSKLCDDYILFLRSLFKARDTASCLDLVYMTGILPIKRYSTESALNMFREYNMLSPRNLTQSFGFTQDEVKTLCEEYHVDFKTMKKWYDGYKLKGLEIYNPQSVVEAITENEFADYWTATGAIESVKHYMNYDHGVLKGTIAKMILGENVPVDVSYFSNDLTKIDSADAALTVLIHLGYLAYDEENKSCYIPNYEIRLEFEKALKELKWNETYDPISNSKKLYEETIKGNTAFIDETLDRNHKEFASMYNKNKEDVLSLVVHISYYSLIDDYFIRKEDTCTTGRADLTFTPRDESHIPMIVELKADASPDDALEQIRNRDYASLFKGYKGKILLLGICYDSKSLKHESRVEFVEI